MLRATSNVLRLRATSNVRPFARGTKVYRVARGTQHVQRLMHDVSSPQAVRKQIAQGKLDPLYLIVGDDDAEMSQLAADLAAVVEDELRAFNFERLYAGEKAASPEAIVQSARTLPMMGDRRVIVVLRAEKISSPNGAARGRKRSSPSRGTRPQTSMSSKRTFAVLSR